MCFKAELTLSSCQVLHFILINQNHSLLPFREIFTFRSNKELCASTSCAKKPFCWAYCVLRIFDWILYFLYFLTMIFCLNLWLKFALCFSLTPSRDRWSELELCKVISILNNLLRFDNLLRRLKNNRRSCLLSHGSRGCSLCLRTWKS